MTTTCSDYDVLVSLRAVGALDVQELARVEGHLAGCAACRAQAGDTAAALSLARLPPVSETERRVYRDLPARTLAAVRRSVERRSRAKKLGAAILAVAAAAGFALAPALLRTGTDAPQARATWQVPSLDEIWEDTEVLDLETAALAGEDEPDAAALAALDL